MYLKMYFEEKLIEDEETSNKSTKIFTSISNEVSNILIEPYQTKPNNK